MPTRATAFSGLAAPSARSWSGSPNLDALRSASRQNRRLGIANSASCSHLNRAMKQINAEFRIQLRLQQRVRGPARRLRDQEFLERLPIVGLPSLCQIFSLALGKPGMVKDDFGPGALFHKFEFRNRVSARVPVGHAPGQTIRWFGTSSTCRPTIMPPKSENDPPASRLICVGDLSSEILGSLAAMI